MPVGWYPTAVRISAAGDRILVANGKGLTSKANRNGPNPLVKKIIRKEGYIGGLFSGALSVIRTPEPEPDGRAEPRPPTSAVRCESDASPTGRAAGAGQSDPEPSLAKPGPIKHCIYIIKENRTYDQVFGDLPQGNGEPGLCLFPERVTPNQHALARQFVLLDNFYVDGEVSANGHEWSMAAYATDYVEKVWPLVYRRGGEHAQGVAAGLPVSVGRHGGDRLSLERLPLGPLPRSTVSYRSYGEFIENGAKPSDPGHARVKALEGHFDPLLPQLRPGLQRPAAGRPLHRGVEAVRARRGRCRNS